MERLIPARRDRHVAVDLLAIETLADAARGAGAITAMVAAGELTPSEGSTLAGIVEIQRRALEGEDLERRITALEANR